MNNPERVRDNAYRWQRRCVLAIVLGAIIALPVLLIMLLSGGGANRGRVCRRGLRR